MLERFYRKSEVWFAVAFIIVYVVGNSFMLQLSRNAGISMVYTRPFNILLLGILFLFMRRNQLFQYYCLNAPKCKSSAVL